MYIYTGNITHYLGICFASKNFQIDRNLSRYYLTEITYLYIIIILLRWGLVADLGAQDRASHARRKLAYCCSPYDFQLSPTVRYVYVGVVF